MHRITPGLKLNLVQVEFRSPRNVSFAFQASFLKTLHQNRSNLKVSWDRNVNQCIFLTKVNWLDQVYNFRPCLNSFVHTDLRVSVDCYRMLCLLQQNQQDRDIYIVTILDSTRQREKLSTVVCRDEGTELPTW